MDPNFVAAGNVAAETEVCWQNCMEPKTGKAGSAVEVTCISRAVSEKPTLGQWC